VEDEKLQPSLFTLTQTTNLLVPENMGMVGEVGDTMRPSLCAGAIETTDVVGGWRSEREVGGRVVRSKRLEPRVRATMEEQRRRREPAGEGRARLGSASHHLHAHNARPIKVCDMVGERTALVRLDLAGSGCRTGLASTRI